MHLGVIGAFGHNDIGDEAMLQNVLNRVQHHCWNVTVYSANPHRVSRYLGIETRPDLSRDIFGLMGNKYVAYVVDLVTAGIMGQSEPWKALLKLKLQRPVRSPVLRRQALQFIERLDHTDARTLRAGVAHRLSDIEGLLMIGGGYINSLWSSRMYPQLLTVSLAKKIGLPVVLSGQTIGPVDEYDVEIIRQALRAVDIIGVRDQGLSAELLEGTLEYRGMIIEAPDNALFLQRADDARRNELLAELGIREHDPFVVVNLRDDVPPSLVHTLGSLVDEGILIVTVPMKPSDRDILKGIVRLGIPADKVIEVPFGASPEDIRAIISKSMLVITQRHHPMVFALGEAVPTIALYRNEYYYRKLMGTMRPFGVEDFCIDLRISEDVILARTTEILAHRTQLVHQLNGRLIQERAREEQFWDAALKVLKSGL